MSNSMPRSGKLTSPSVVRALLDEHRLSPQKRFGQNFLCDENTLQNIIEAADLKPGEAVFEIGGGLGALSQQIALRGCEVAVVEIDRGLAAVLSKNLEPYQQVSVIEGDALKQDWGKLFAQHKKFKTLGNLPYNITAPLLEKLIEHRGRIETAIWMMQLEVAQKITAQPGTRESGSLGIYIQSYCDVKQLLRVSKNAYYPKPEVDSAVVKISPCPEPKFNAAPEIFNKIVRAAFGMRRKTLLKALSLSPNLELSKDGVSDVLKLSGIDERRRGETLLIEEFDRIALHAEKFLRG